MFGFRPLVAAWNLLFLRKGPLALDPAQPADWNRGRTLAEGLAHCGACHTPRNELGAERSEHAYDGAWIEGWYAPPLNAKSPAVRPWTADELFAYLRTGLSSTHAAAAGPMGRVTRGLADYLSLSFVEIESPREKDKGLEFADWAILTANKKLLAALSQTATAAPTHCVLSVRSVMRHA